MLCAVSSMAELMPHVQHLAGVFDHAVLAATLRAVARTGVADHITEEPRAISDVARDAGVDALALRRVLRVLEPDSIFEITGDDVAALPLGTLLRTTSPFWSTLATVGAIDVASALDHSLRTGRSAWEHVHGAPFWDWLATHPHQEQTFAASMQDQVALTSAAAVPLFGLSGALTVADIAGGTGTLLTAVLDAHPIARGILVDLPSVLEHAVVDRSRCELHPGDLFGPMPHADAYVLARVLHDWPDEDCRRILRGIRSAADDGARLFDIDLVVPEDREPHPSKLADINMLLLFGGGRERTQTELDALLASTGWRVDRIDSLPLGCLLTATAV